MPDGDPTASDAAAAAERFIDFARLVIEERERTGRSRYPQGEWSIFKNHFVPAHFAQTSLQRVDETDIQQWVEESTKKKTRAGTGTPRDAETINPETIKKHISLCRQVFEAAGPKGYKLLSRNPVADYTKSRPYQELIGSYAPREKWDYLQPEEQQIIRNCEAIDLDHRLIILFAIGTGIRQGVQFNQLKRDDLHVTGPRPHVRVPGEGESSTSETDYREVPLLGPSLEAAKEWLELLKSGYGASNPERLLFPFKDGARRRHSGKPFAGDNAFTRDLKKAGIEREIRWADLRHTCAVSMARGFFGGKRYSITEIGAMLGIGTSAAADYYDRFVQNRIESDEAGELPDSPPRAAGAPAATAGAVIHIASAHVESVEVKGSSTDHGALAAAPMPPKWSAERLELDEAKIREQVPEMQLPPSALSQALSAIVSGKHLLLVGPPGTGKTALAQAITRAATDAGYCNDALLVTASADWTTFDTIGGNSLGRDGSLRFIPGMMPRAIDARRWLVIDEFNRADIDRAFGELMTVLSGHTVETGYLVDGRRVRIGSDVDSTHHVPRSFRVLATMNTWDKTSLFRLSFAVQRRFAIVDVGAPDDEAYALLIRDSASREGSTLTKRLAPELIERLVGLFSHDGLLGVRPVGPAIALDVVSYIRHRVPRAEEPLEALGEAIQMFVLPQLEGLMQNDAVRVHDIFSATLKGLSTSKRETLQDRFFEVFPTVDRRAFARERHARR